MSNELLAAARSDDLPTIADALVQWLIVERGASIVEHRSGYPFLKSTVTTKAHAWSTPLPSPARGEKRFRDC
jgi:hypothetical protein